MDLVAIASCLLAPKGGPCANYPQLLNASNGLSSARFGPEPQADDGQPSRGQGGGRPDVVPRHANSDIAGSGTRGTGAVRVGHMVDCVAHPAEGGEGALFRMPMPMG